jgi:hypothetical protein
MSKVNLHTMNKSLINCATVLLISLPLVAIGFGDKLYETKIGTIKVGNEAQLLAIVSSGFIGLVGASYLQATQSDGWKSKHQ